MKTHNQVLELAEEAAHNAINNASSEVHEMYFGDEAICDFWGLVACIVNIYYDDYNNKNFTKSLFEDIAFDLVA